MSFARPTLGVSATRHRKNAPRIAHATSALAEVAFWRRDFRQAIELQKPDLELLRSSGLLADEAVCLGNLGACYRRLDLLEEAAFHLQRALQATSALGDLSLLMDTIVEIAALALRRDDDVAAARLLGGADRLRNELGFPLYDVADYQKTLVALRARLAREELDRHWQEGAAIERSELVEEALHSVRIP